MESFRRGELSFDVIDTGPRDGEVVVLLHGFPQFADSWTHVAKRLADRGYRCIAPDQRGYSPGARPTGRRAYRASELVADIRALIDSIGVEKVHLVGHDWGAAAGWAFAAEHPDVLADFAAFSVPHPAAFLRSLVRSRQVLASWYMYAFQLPGLPERLLSRGGGARFRHLLESAGQSPAAAQRDARRMIDSGALRGAIGWYRAIPLTDPRTTGAKVRVPTLFVWSDGDTAVLCAGAQRCGDWVSGPYRFEVLHGVSHWIPDEVPDRAADLLLEHFAAHPAGAARTEATP